MTIARLDAEMEKFEKKQASRLVALTEAGAPHDHAKCPRLEAGTHKGTPINPQGFGRKINIYGDHETDYLGFEDYAIDPAYRFQDDGGLSPLTWAPPAQGGLADHCASDICMRSSPVYDEKDRVRGLIKPRSTTGEIKRIAMPGCRLTYAGSDDNVKLFGSKVLQLGALMETVVIIEPAHVDPSGTFFPESRLIVYVLTIF